MLKVHQLTYSMWQENTYLLAAENGDCIVIDPGCLSDAEKQHFAEYISTNNLNPVRMINTHLHLDHVFGCRFVAEKYNLKLEAHPDDEFWVERTVEFSSQMGVDLDQNPPAVENYIQDEEEIEFGGSVIKFLHIPGHTPGHLVFYLEKEKVAIVGDVLFKNSVGRADLPGGDFDTLINGIKSKLMVLPDDVKTYSGHGPSSTIGEERVNNMFLR